jgi:hypothetical protein
MERRNFVGEGQRAKPTDLCGGAVQGRRPIAPPNRGDGRAKETPP